MSFAVDEETQPHSLNSWRVYAPATRGAEMQNRTLVATCTQPLNQPTVGWTSLDSHAYEAPQSGSRRLRWK
jgi:hypothetical protein